MRTSLHVPDDLLAEFDRTWRAEGLESRSRALREAIGEYVEGHTHLESLDGEVTAAIAYDYDHHDAGELYELQHEFEDAVTATNHVHRGDRCLETVLCDGAGERVRDLVYALRDADGVRRVKVMLLSG